LEKNKVFDANWYCPVCGIKREKGNHDKCSRMGQLKYQQGKHGEKIIAELDMALEDELKKLVLEQNEDLLTTSHPANQ